MKLTIDTNKCDHCGVCLEICPEKIIEYDSISRFPTITGKSCIKCGHCMAVCPTRALSHSELANLFTNSDNTPHPINFESQEFYHFLASKRSNRNFSDRVPTREIIQNIIAVSAFSPSDNNTEDRKHIIITDKILINKIENSIAKYFSRLFKILNRPVRVLLSLFVREMIKNLEPNVVDLKSLNMRYLSGSHPIFRNAPVIVITYANKGNTLSRDNCLAAQHYMMLYAKTLGIESCIIGYASSALPAIHKHIKIPGNQKIFAVTALGYPKFKFKQIIKRPLPNIRWL
jgi:ferredoxin